MRMPNLLIADSSEEFALSLSVALQASFKVCCCKNGKEALEQFQRDPPEVIVLDLMLPEIDGISLLHIIHQQNFHPTILATTRLISDYVIENVQKLGIGYLIVKPCDVSSITERVLDLCKLATSAPAMSPKARIANILSSLGIAVKLRGYAYLQDAILLMVERPGMSITKELYPSVGDIHNTTGVLVERSIRSAVKGAWEKRDNQIWQKYFLANADGDVPHPTNAQFIARLAEILRERL